MPKKYYFALYLNLTITVALLGFIFFRPYVVDDIFDVDGNRLGFKGIYDNPMIFFITAIGFLSSFVNLLLISFLYFKNSIFLYKKWVISTILSTFLFLFTILYHQNSVEYSHQTAEYKQAIQEKLGVWNQKPNSEVKP